MVTDPGNLHCWWYFQRRCRATCQEEHDCRTHPLISQLDTRSRGFSDAPGRI